MGGESLTLARTCKRCGWLLKAIPLHGVSYLYCENSNCYYHTNAHP